MDAFVTKLNPAGSAVVYSTYIGGNGVDGAIGIAVDGSGNGYVTGLHPFLELPDDCGRLPEQSWACSGMRS